MDHDIRIRQADPGRPLGRFNPIISCVASSRLSGNAFRSAPEAQMPLQALLLGRDGGHNQHGILDSFGRFLERDIYDCHLGGLRSEISRIFSTPTRN